MHRMPQSGFFPLSMMQGASSCNMAQISTSRTKPPARRPCTRLPEFRDPERVVRPVVLCCVDVEWRHFPALQSQQVIEGGYERAMWLLLENGADWNVTDKDGIAPLLEGSLPAIWKQDSFLHFCGCASVLCNGSYRFSGLAAWY